MPDDTLRWPGGWARLGSWRGEHDVAYLAVGAQRPPSAEVLDRCLRTLRGRGFQRVLTNALAPAEALPFVDAGFSVHERLHLLAHDLTEIPAGDHETRRGRSDDHGGVLALDRRAFRPFWRLDRDGLEQALDATPATRFRVVEGEHGLLGYAVTGRADRRGYLQRVGVEPAAQGRGVGRSLVADALRWLRRHRARDAVVNTQLDNVAALSLYRSCGFRELPSGLCVMSRALVKRFAGLAALALVVTVLAAPGTADARRAPAGRVVLHGQPAWSTLGDDVQLRLGIRAEAGASLEVNAVVHTAVSSRIAFDRTINGDRLGSTVTSLTQPVASLPVVGSDHVFTLPLQDPDTARDPARIRLTIPGSGPAGVFPVEIELRDAQSGDVVSSFVTELVAVRRIAAGTAPSPTRLQVAWLWHAAASPSTTPSGAPAPVFAAELGATGRLGRLTESLQQIGGVPVTLVPNPETVAGAEALSTNPDASRFVDGLRDVAATSSILAGPFTTIDGPALLRAGLDDALSAQLALGREALEQELDAAVDHTIAAPQPLDSAMLARLRADAGTTRLVVEPDVLAEAAPADQFTPARPFRLDTTAGSFDALEVDRTTSELLVRRGADALRAQQMLAGLTVVALEQPNRSRGIVIDTPVRWDPRPNRVGAVLAGLRDHPLLTGARLTDIFDSVQAATVNGKPYVRSLAPAPAGDAPLTAGEYRRARNRVDALASMVGTTDATVTKARHELEVAPATGVPRTGPAVSGARLATIRTLVASISDKIIAPPSRTFRLTSRRASVPLSIENATDQPVRVRIQLSSQKLEFPDGSDRVVELPPGNTTTQFEVESRASGTFPVLVTVSSPDGGLALQRSRYTIRSSFVSGVGVFLAVGAGLFLAIWWLTHWRRSRKARTPALAS